MNATKIAVVFLSILTGGCAGNGIQEQIQASSEGRALERMADNLSQKASSHCSIIRTGGIFSASETVTISCPPY